jgi:RNA polymerase sigma-70 factor, ECF subfamily
MLSLADRSSDDRWEGWISQIARGDESALASFYDATRRLVYGLAFRILGDTGAAQEVTFDVYLQVWRQANLFDSTRGRVSAWLLVMARSRALDKLRVRPQESSQHETLETLAEVRSDAPGPEESAVIAQLLAHVRLTLQTLSEEQREAIELAYFSGLSQNEIALHLNQPLGTIKTRIRNGMIRLRRQMQSREGEWRSKQMSRTAPLG